MTTEVSNDKSHLQALKTAHLTAATKLLLPTAPQTSAHIGRELLAIQTPQKRKRISTNPPTAPLKRAKPPSAPQNGEYCTHCGTPLAPGCSCTASIESIRTSRHTHALKRASQAKQPRKSKRRKAEWDVRKVAKVVEEEQGEALWASSKELRMEYERAAEEGAEWAVRAREVLGRWDEQRQQDVAERKENEGKRRMARKKGPDKPVRRRKRLALACGHCSSVTRIPLDPPVMKPSILVAQGQNPGTKVVSRVQPADTKEGTAQSQGAKAKARAKLRKQGVLKGLMAKSRAEEEKDKGGLGLMDLMKST